MESHAPEFPEGTSPFFGCYPVSDRSGQASRPVFTSLAHDHVDLHSELFLGCSRVQHHTNVMYMALVHATELMHIS